MRNRGCCRSSATGETPATRGGSATGIQAQANGATPRAHAAPTHSGNAGSTASSATPSGVPAATAAMSRAPFQQLPFAALPALPRIPHPYFRSRAIELMLSPLTK